MPYEISALNGPVAISHDTEQGRREDLARRRRRPTVPSVPAPPAGSPDTVAESPTDPLDTPAVGTHINVRV